MDSRERLSSTHVATIVTASNHNRQSHGDGTFHSAHVRAPTAATCATMRTTPLPVRFSSGKSRRAST